MASRTKQSPVVLTIAGSDSSGGAGIQADARAIQALGGFAATVITAITAQNSRGVRRWQPVEPALVRAQLEAVLADLDVRAIKTGLLPLPQARTVARLLARHPRIPVIVDPVLGSTSGTRFVGPREIDAWIGLMGERATLLTPNWPEVGALAGFSVKSFAAAERAGQHLAQKFGCAVLVKGGHAPGDRCDDLLVGADGKETWFSSARVRTRNTHGTGCVLSAAIATRLARGDDLRLAVVSARRFLQRSLRGNVRLRLGSGRGPALP